MGWMTALEQRQGVSLEDPNVPLGTTTLLDLFGGRKSTSGVRVNPRTATHYSAVYAAISKISGTLQSVPLKVYQRRSDGGKDEARDHRLWETLAVAPNPELTSVRWRENSQGHLLTRGNAYSVIEGTRTGSPELYPLNPDRVTPKRRSDGSLVYEYTVGEGPALIFRMEEIVHVRNIGEELLGWSPIRLARESIGLGIATEEYGNRFFGQSARPSGLLTTPEGMKPETRKKLGTQFAAAYQGLPNAHKVVVLEQGLQWQAMGLSQEDAQFLETRKFQIREVARWFGLPPHKIGDLEDATFSNITEQSIEYVVDTMMPWVSRWESELEAKLLTPQERARGFFIRFVMDGLLRGDPEKRAAFYQTRHNTGSITPNEIRALEDQNPIDGGDEAFIQVNMIPLSQAQSLTVGERQSLMLAEHGVETRAERAGGVEKRSPALRIRLVSTFRPLFTDRAQRLVRGEIRDVRRQFKKEPLERFIDWLDDYYFDAFTLFAGRTMLPIFEAYAEAVAAAAIDETGFDEPPPVDVFTDAYATGFVSRHAASSRKQLRKVAEAEDPSTDLESRLAAWSEGTENARPRDERVTDREIHQLANAVARMTFAAAGVQALRWRKHGDTCPYCNGMDGTIIGIRENFFNEGDEFQPEDADSALKMKTRIAHPPIHKGCDCYIEPA